MTEEQYQRILVRLSAIEEMIDDIVTVLNKASTAASIGKVVTLFETELDDIKNRLTSVEENVETLFDDQED